MSDLALAIARVDPADSTSAYNAALDALRQGLEEEGLRLLERARRVSPHEPRLWQVAGLLHRQLDDLAPAIALMEEAARLAPADALIAHSLARIHLEAGLPSVDRFRAAQRLAPQDGEVLLGLVAALENDVSPSAAVAELERLLAAHPGWMAGIEVMMRLRWQCGDREGFTRDYERALGADPRNVGLWRSLILALTQADQYVLGLEAVLRGREAAGPHLIFDVNEAVCRGELGQSEAAERLFARFADLDDATLRVRHVRHLLRTGRPAEAAALAETMSRTPSAAFFWPYLSIAWRLIGDARWEWLEGDPRFVGVYELGDRLPSLDALAERLRALHRMTHQPLEQSVRGGTQTQGTLFSRLEPEIRALRAAVVDAVAAHVAQLPPPQPGHPLLSVPRGRRVRFSGSWSVRLTGGGHHANHIHPMGWFSSALYVALPAAETRGAPPAGWLTLGEPQAELGIDMPPLRMIEPRPGRLVLFPSTMWHGTVPFDEGERLSVAFDVTQPL
jgi:tetratricopeptide (TPR) repeat protein